MAEGSVADTTFDHFSIWMTNKLYDCVIWELCSVNDILITVENSRLKNSELIHVS